MALKFNELIHSRPGLLVIRQTRLEPTLKTLAGLGITGMVVWFSIPLVTSQMFVEELNLAARFVPGAFLGIILLFGLTLTISGILQLIQPTEYQFDSYKKAYLKNGHIKATVNQLNGAGFYRRSSGNNSSYYQLFLNFKKGKQIKLMKANSHERAEELANEINKILNLPGTENTFVNNYQKYQKIFLLIWLVAFFTIIIGAAVSFFWPGLLTNKSAKINEKYIPYSGREGEIKNRKLKGVLFQRKLNGKWRWDENGDENRDGKYVGEIALGKPNGFGIYENSKGDRYEGEWRGGRWHGQGIYSYPDERKVVGEFRGGKDWNTKEYDKDGNIIGKWVNGKQQ